jgi:hypothetical protein
MQVVNMVLSLGIDGIDPRLGGNTLCNDLKNTLPVHLVAVFGVCLAGEGTFSDVVLHVDDHHAT